jgi:toxin-antitoxin system PIN domain toxin
MSRARPALLDVNVLIALFDADHVHHDLSHDWFAEHHADGWATCALTQNGFLRVLTNPRSPVAQDRATIFNSLRTLCDSRHHQFWSESVSLTDESLFDASVIVSHRQLADIYLLGLALRTKGRLVTLDGKIPLKAVRGASRDCLVVIGG